MWTPIVPLIRNSLLSHSVVEVIGSSGAGKTNVAHALACDTVQFDDNQKVVYVDLMQSFSPHLLLEFGGSETTHPVPSWMERVGVHSCRSSRHLLFLALTLSCAPPAALPALLIIDAVGTTSLPFSSQAFSQEAKALALLFATAAASKVRSIPAFASGPPTPTPIFSASLSSQVARGGVSPLPPASDVALFQRSNLRAGGGRGLVIPQKRPRRQSNAMPLIEDGHPLPVIEPLVDAEPGKTAPHWKGYEDETWVSFRGATGMRILILSGENMRYGGVGLRAAVGATFRVKWNGEGCESDSFVAMQVNLPSESARDSVVGV